MLRIASVSSLIITLCLLSCVVSIAADIVLAEYGVSGKKNPNDNVVFTVNNERTMYPGEVIKVNYILKRGEAIYIIWQSPRGNHTLINGGNTLPEKNRAYSTNWYSLDFEAGNESIFVIISTSQLKKLDDLFAGLAKSEGKNAIKINEEIAREISSIKIESNESMKQMDLAATAEDPVEGATVYRGSGADETIINKKG